MKAELIEIRAHGKTLFVPSATVQGRTVVAPGSWLKIAAVQDEDFVEGPPVADPQSFITGLKAAGIKADIFTFVQKLPETRAKYDYHLEHDSVAAIPTTTYNEWFKQRLSHNARGEISRAKKRGVTVKVVELNDDLIKGIVKIYAETPFRQGRRFWHYGKDFDTIKKEKITYLERSEFIGAYLGDELIGFMKTVYDGPIARMTHITSMMAHHDKRPTNALLAKAVEMCEARKSAYLIYGKYNYGRTQTSLAEFKRRNGFEEFLLPRYYVPLTLKGLLALKLGVHHGWTALIPKRLVAMMIDCRAKFMRWNESRKQPAQPAVVEAKANEKEMNQTAPLVAEKLTAPPV